MQRTNLLDLEGQLVIATGIAKEWRSNPDGTVNVCLAACEVRRFDPAAVMAKVPARRVDHMWRFGLDPEAIQSKKLLERRICFGRVGWYERRGAGKSSAGAVDLTVYTEPSIRLDDILEMYRISMKTGSSTKQLLKLLENYEEERLAGAPMYAWRTSTKAAQAELKRALEVQRRNLKADQQRCFPGLGVASPVLLPAVNPPKASDNSSCVERLLKAVQGHSRRPLDPANPLHAFS